MKMKSTGRGDKYCLKSHFDEIVPKLVALKRLSEEQSDFITARGEIASALYNVRNRTFVIHIWVLTLSLVWKRDESMGCRGCESKGSSQSESESRYNSRSTSDVNDLLN